MSKQRNVNSLDRFRKQPGRFVLEQHGNCEVPAGCGGVVLRWRNPNTSVPFLFHMYSPGTALRGFLDGKELTSSRVEIAPGRHVVAFELQDAARTEGLLLFVAVRQERQGHTVTEGGVLLVSVVDGSWKATHDPPAEDWTAVTFDDQLWRPLERMELPEAAWRAPARHRVQRCLEAAGGAFGELGQIEYIAGTSPVRPKGYCLGLPHLSDVELQRYGPRGAAWVRKVFDVPQPALAAADEGDKS
jgi:hypothetical protein